MFQSQSRVIWVGWTVWELSFTPYKVFAHNFCKTPFNNSISVINFLAPLWHHLTFYLNFSCAVFYWMLFVLDEISWLTSLMHAKNTHWLVFVWLRIQWYGDTMLHLVQKSDHFTCFCCFSMLSSWLFYSEIPTGFFTFPIRMVS